MMPLEVQRPPRYSVTSPRVCCTHSIAANLIGWSSAIERAAVSPTANWMGVAIAATVSGINSPRRWWRSRRPLSIPTAYTDATRKPVTRYAARIMCGTSYAVARLKIASRGATSVTCPFEAIVNPSGWFIHELTATTENAPPSPEMTTGTPAQKCAHGDRYFQPKM